MRPWSAGLIGIIAAAMATSSLAGLASATGPRLSITVNPSRTAVDIEIENPLAQTICVRPTYQRVERFAVLENGRPLPGPGNIRRRNPSECVLLQPRGVLSAHYDVVTLYPDLPNKPVEFCYALPWNPGTTALGAASTKSQCVTVAPRNRLSRSR